MIFLESNLEDTFLIRSGIFVRKIPSNRIETGFIDLLGNVYFLSPNFKSLFYSSFYHLNQAF